MSNSLQVAYNKIRKLKGIKLTEPLCTAVMDAWGSAPFRENLQRDKKNPFCRILLHEWYRPSCDIASRDIAEIFLKQIARERENAEWMRTATPEQRLKHYAELTAPDLNGFVRLDEFIKNIASMPVMEEMYEWLFFKPDISQILWAYFNANTCCLDDALDHVCMLVYHGAPLYIETNGSFSAISQSDHDYIYLSKKAQYGETGSGGNRPGCIPAWAKQFFLRSSDLREHQRLYGFRMRGHNAEAVAALREAYRARIGMLKPDSKKFYGESWKRVPPCCCRDALEAAQNSTRSCGRALRAG